MVYQIHQHLLPKLTLMSCWLNLKRMGLIKE
jgi:hypothetical protein